MSINIIVNSRPYKNFDHVSVGKSLDNMTGVFNFLTVNSSNFMFPFSVGDPCQILVNDEQVIDGFIDKISGSYGPDTHKLTVSGRDKTSDVVDSTIGKSIEFSSATISLKKIIEETLSKVGIAGISVINNVPGLADFTSADVVSGKIGDTVFHFLEQYARKRQVLLTSNNKGDIVITRSANASSSQYILNQINNNQNNVLSGNFSYDNSRRFHKYLFWSQLNAAALNVQFVKNPNSAGVTAKGMATNFGESEDINVRTSRIFNSISEQSTDVKGLTNRAIWEGNIRRSRAITYHPVVQGFQFNESSPLWSLNTLVHVIDDFAQIDAIMLVNNVNFTMDLSMGSRTELSLVDKDSYKLKLEIDKDSQKANKLTQNVFFS